MDTHGLFIESKRTSTVCMYVHMEADLMPLPEGKKDGEKKRKKTKEQKGRLDSWAEKPYRSNPWSNAPTQRLSLSAWKKMNCPALDHAASCMQTMGLQGSSIKSPYTCRGEGAVYPCVRRVSYVPSVISVCQPTYNYPPCLPPPLLFLPHLLSQGKNKGSKAK